MKRSLCRLVALGLLVGITGPARAQPSYTFTILDVPGSSNASAIALGINAAGQIVGSYSDAAYLHHGFLYDQGSYTTLDVPGANYTHASGINDSGQVVGYYFA
jgi:probable HAF family extracellular repeat protein